MRPDRPLRIWHVNVGNHAGAVDGVAVVAARLASEQADAGHDVRLVVAADPIHHEGVRASTGAGLELTLTATPGAALRAAWPLLAEPDTRPDVVHLHSVFRPVHRLLVMRARRLGVPVVLSPHCGLAPGLMDRDRLRKAIYGGLIERRFYRSADGVHALQRIEHEDVVGYAGRARPVEIIPNPVDRTVADAEPWRARRTARATRVVLLCRYDVYQKGLDRLVAMARALPVVEFWVHGTTDKNQPERALALIEAAPANLHFAPPVHGPDKLSQLRSADLFLQPSRVEGLSVALAEAMTLGLPCAVSGYVGRSLAMKEHRTALVLHDDPALAAGQLATLLDDRRRRVALGRAAREYALSRFAPDVVVRRHLEHYRSLMIGRASLAPRR